MKPADTALRRRVLAAVAETGFWRGVRPARRAAVVPAASCPDRENWFALSAILCDAILDDADYELADSLLDLEPEVAQAVKQLLAIDRDYFVNVPDDPSPAQLAEVRQELHGFLDEHNRAG